MQLPSARPEERSIYAFCISPLYTAAQVILAVFIPVLFLIAANFLMQANVISADNPGTVQQVAFIAGALIGLVPLLAAVYLRLARNYFITTERVIAVTGWLAQQTVSIDYQTITDLTIDQDVFERFITRSGDLSVDTAGSPTEEITFIHIANPKGVRDQILELVEKAKELLMRSGTQGTMRPIVVAPSSAASPIQTNPDVVDADDDGVIDADERTGQPAPAPQPDQTPGGTA